MGSRCVITLFSCLLQPGCHGNVMLCQGSKAESWFEFQMVYICLSFLRVLWLPHPNHSKIYRTEIVVVKTQEALKWN